MRLLRARKPWHGIDLPGMRAVMGPTDLDFDDESFESMTDEQVLALAASYLREEADLPPLSLARQAAGQKYDRAKEELDRRLMIHVTGRLQERGDLP